MKPRLHPFRLLFPAGLFLFSASVCESAPVVVIYNTAGTTSFTAPVGVFTIQAETWGGGGAGGSGRKDISGGSNTSQNGGGGGGGAYAARLAVPVGLLPSYTIIIPAAAVSGTNGTTVQGGGAVNGGDVTFTGDSGVLVKANGGSGGRNAYVTGNQTTGQAGGAGGTVALSVGDLGRVFAGGAGSAGNTGGTNVSGSGGGGAGDLNPGGDASTTASTTTAGIGGVTGGGNGGAGRAGGNTNAGPGGDGSAAGGGGGGGHNQGTSTRLGGTGGLGQITLTYIAPLSWNTGDGDWDTSANNWLDTSSSLSAAYVDAASPVLFADATAVSGNPTVTLNSTFSPFGGVTMSSTLHDYTISGSGSISGTGIQVRLASTNTRTLTLSTANNYTGATTVNGGTLKLDYSSQDNSKLSDTDVLTLGGGTLNLSGGTHTEVVVSTTLTANTSSFVTQTGGTATLQMGVITRNSDAFIDFGAPNIATTNNTNTNGILGAWATINNGSDFAVNSTNLANGLITAPAAYTDVTRLNGGTQVISDGSTSFVRISEGTGSAANITLGAATTSMATLTQSAVGGTSAAIIDPAGQTLATSAILVATGAGSLTIGTGTNNGSVSALTPGGDLAVNATGSSTVTMNSAIIDNATSTLTKVGSGTLVLNGVNTYTGATSIVGTLQVAGSGSLGSGSYAGNILGSGSLQYSSSASQTLSGANTYTGATVVSGGTLNLTGVSGYKTTALSVASGATLGITMTGNATSLGANTSGTWTTFNSVNAAITGAGVVALNGTDFISAGGSGGTMTTNLAAGGVLDVQSGSWAWGYAKGSAATNLGSLNVNSGAEYRNSDAAFQFDALTGAGNVANAFSSAVTLTLGVSNTTDNATYGVAGNSATFSGTIQSGDTYIGVTTGALSLVKTGTGTQVLSGANTYTGSTTVSAGTLILSGNRTATAGAITVGNVNGTTGTLNISNGTFSTGTFAIGASVGVTNAVGVVNQTGGTLTLTGTQMIMGNGGSGGTPAGQGGVGTYNLSGGTLTATSVANRGVILGTNDGGTSSFNLSGTGILSLTGAASQLMVGRSDSPVVNTTNLFNQTGGTATVSILTIGGAAAAATGLNSTFTVTGGTFSATSFTSLGVGNSGIVSMNIGGSADVTLPNLPTARGTLTTATLNLDGGILRNSATGIFITGLTNAFIKAGGANFDTSLNSTTVAQALLHDAGLGVTLDGGLTKSGINTLTLTNTNSYIGPTAVSAGTLEVSGSLSGTTSVSVTNGTLLLSANNITNSTNTPSLVTNTGVPTVALGGGTLKIIDSMSTLSETFGSLALSTTSTLDFGTGSNNRFIFDSLSISTGVLNVLNWSVGDYAGQDPDTGTTTNDRLVFSNDVSSLVGQINFYSGDTTLSGFLGTGSQISFGSQIEIVPVPEPGALGLLGSVALCALGSRQRRRLSRKSAVNG